MAGLTLDAGALIAFERKDRRVVGLLARALAHRQSIAIPAGVVAQVWRSGRRQVPLARLLGASCVEVVPFDDFESRRAGQLCGARGTRDVIDASVVVCAQERRHRVLTSDPEDLRALDPKTEIIAV